MRRFEFRDDKSAKFWAIELAGRSFTVNFGKIGSAGQTQTKEFKDEAKAKSEHDKLVAEKLAKGYKETTAAAPAPAAPAPAKPARATPAPATPAPAIPAPAKPAPAAVASSERTFVCGTEQSFKFWNITLQGKGFTVRFGKVGTAGQTQTKEFKDEAKAKSEHDKLIAEKLAKDYVETTPATPTRGNDAIRDGLEAAIREDADDLAAHSALADYLQEQGDPRGEFIAVQLALEDPKRSAAQRGKLDKRERELFYAHGRDWVGPTLDAAGFGWDAVQTRSQNTTFSRGWLWAVTIDNAGDDEQVRTFQALSATPEARFVHDLTLDREPQEAALKALAKATFAPFLRRLHLGESESYTHTGGGCLATLVPAFPRLETLIVYAHVQQEEAARLFAAPMPWLRELELCCTWHYPLDVLANNPTLTRLRRVNFFPHMLERGDAAYLNAGGLRELGASKHLKALADVTFKLWDGGDAAADALVETGLLLRLERLNLELGNLTDAGARTLAGALASGSHRLRFLDLSHNAVTPPGLDALRKTGVEVVCTGSHNPDHNDYLACGEGDAE
jgi:uncharacterized protein (TIGR02996 family)